MGACWLSGGGDEQLTRAPAGNSPASSASTSGTPTPSTKPSRSGSAINRTDLRCLDLLLDLAMAGRDITPARLGDASGLTPSTVTSVLDRLEKAGYIRRVRDQENRRQVFLQLTEEFVALTRELFGPVATEATRQLEQFSDEEMATLIKFFSQAHDQRVKRTQKVRDGAAGNASGPGRPRPKEGGQHVQGGGMGQVRTSSIAGRELAIAFDSVTKRYGPVQALAGVSFAIERGEMVALLGPNGAGKSTTVDLMLGLRRPDTGSVRILGSAPQQAVEDGRVGAMLQSGSLPERATVGEVVDLARRLYGSQRSLTALLDLAALARPHQPAHRQALRGPGTPSPACSGAGWPPRRAIPRRADHGVGRPVSTTVLGRRPQSRFCRGDRRLRHPLPRRSRREREPRPRPCPWPGRRRRRSGIDQGPTI